MRQISAGFMILFLLTPYVIIKYGGLSMLAPLALVLVLSYYFVLNEVIRRSVALQDKAGKVYKRSNTYVDVWTYFLIILLFMLNAFLFEGEFRWLFISISALALFHLLINYHIDSKYALQKLAITEEELQLTLDIEQRHEWSWLKENAELKENTLHLKGFSRPNIKLDRFQDYEKAIAEIKKKLS